MNSQHHSSTTPVILGITAFNHDSSAALIVGDQLIAFAEEERFNKVKHTASFPSGAIKFCLEEAGLTRNDITDVAFYFNLADCWKSYLVHNNPLYALKDFSVFRRKRFIFEFIWLINFHNQVQSMKRVLGNPTINVHLVKHHVAHTWYGYYAASMEGCVVLSNDSVGESTSTLATLFESTNDLPRTTDLIKQKDPHSLGYLYGAVTDYLGFKRGEGEGRVMALASFGTSKEHRFFKENITLHDKGTFRINRRLLWNRSFAPRGQRLGTDFYKRYGANRAGDAMQKDTYDIASGIQNTLEYILEHQISYLTKFHTKIVLTGGVAQNSVANGLIKDKYPHIEVIVPPVPHDAGCAIGAAVYINATTHQTKVQPCDTGKLGPSYSNKYVVALLKNAGVAYRTIKGTHHVAELLADNKTVIFFRNNMESGPRALCNRSIIASPISKTMRDHLNEKVKYREWFRPYGGFIQAKDVDTVLEHPNQHKAGPYMSFVYKVSSAWQEKIPSLVHVDGTCRVQIVEDDKYLKNLLDSFSSLTGVPMLINTSLNLRGQPIARSPEDALSVFYTSNVDYLIFNESILIEKVKS